jgi:hypothetical protein
VDNPAEHTALDRHVDHSFAGCGTLGQLKTVENGVFYFLFI